MLNLWQDLRYGLRTLAKNPGFTTVAILALTLGIGANSAIFTVVNAILLRPLNYQNPDRLIIMSERTSQFPSMTVAYPNFADWRAQNTVFDHIAVYRRDTYDLTGVGEPEQLPSSRASADLFPTLGVAALYGRTFTESEDQPGANPVVVLSYGLWQRRFGMDKGIIGQALTLAGKQYTVIGIMPPSFQFPNRAELWLPAGQFSTQPGWVERDNHPGLFGVARLKPGVSLARAQAEMDTIAARLERQYPNSNTGSRVNLTPLMENTVKNIRPALYVLLGAVGLVLLIACANVANLLLARAATRKKEIAVRLALGAGRFRLIRQLLTESVMLALIGGSLGLLLANWAVKLLININPTSLPRIREIDLDWRVFGFTLVLAALTGIVFGLAPALQATKADLNDALKESARGSTGGIRHQRFRSALIISEIGLSLALLIAAGLMIKSFSHLLHVDTGFNPDHVLTAQLSLPRARYVEPAQATNFERQLIENIGHLPGVVAAGFTDNLALTNGGNQTGVFIEGRTAPKPGNVPFTELARVSPDFFRAMGVELLQGRFFSDQDTPSAPRVAIIDEAFAHRFWPNEDAVGKRFSLGDASNPLTTVVGVVRTVAHDGLDSSSKYVQSYRPYQQSATNDMNLIVRTVGTPLESARMVQNEVAKLDKDLPISSVRSMDQIVADSVAAQRLNVLLLGIFAIVALTLAAVGIYGVMAYSVNQRTHEIGLRVALGAQQKDILKLVVGQGMSLTIIGIALGLGTAWLLTRWMASLLFGVSATDPTTFISLSVFLSLIALIACYAPARRAAKIDPMIALRFD